MPRHGARRLIGAAPLAVLLVALAGCAGDGSEVGPASSASPSDEPANPSGSPTFVDEAFEAIDDLGLPEPICDLVINDEVADALGVSERPEREDRGDQCVFSFDGGRFGMVLRDHYTYGGARSPRQIYRGTFGASPTSVRFGDRRGWIVTGHYEDDLGISAAGGVERGSDFDAVFEFYQRIGLAEPDVGLVAERLLELVAEQG